MAQKRLRDYQSPLGSFLHNLINLGVHLPGRFAGFSGLVITGQTQFSLAHGGGISTFDNTGTPYGPFGIAMTVQGEMIIEDAPIPGFNITPNNTANDRTDWIVMTHQYILVSGGGAATYSILVGPNPVLQPYQVIIGVLIVPAGVLTSTGCQYQKAPCPDSGDSPDAKLSVPNTFSAIQAQSMAKFPFTAPSVIDGFGASMYDLPPSANSYPFAPVNNIDIDGIRISNNFTPQDGMEINLIINRYCRIKNNPPFQPNGVYEPILFSNRLSTGTVTIGVTGSNVVVNTFQPPADDTAIWVVRLIRYQSSWIVCSIDGPGFSPVSFIRGMLLGLEMPITQVPANFDAFGVGTGQWTGWQIANGNGGFSDWRGRVPVGATDVPAQGQPPVLSALLPPGVTKLSQGSFGGSAKFTLSQANLPAVGLKLLSNATGGQAPWFTMDAGGGGGNYSLKGDSDNSLINGYITTENMGSGTAFQMMPPYQVTMWIVKL